MADGVVLISGRVIQMENFRRFVEGLKSDGLYDI